MVQYFTPYYPEGVHNIDEQIVLPRRKSRIKAPYPYLGGGVQTPAGRLHGADREGTYLVFDPSIEDALITTEDYATCTRWWNGGASTTALGAMVENMTIDGRAEFRPYPYGYPGDAHGQSHPNRATGIRLAGMGGRVRNVTLFQIPGTAINLIASGGAQSGAYGAYDKSLNEVDHVDISHALNGIVSNVGLADTKINFCHIQQVALDGLTLWGGVARNCHIWGADRALVCGYQTRVYDSYMEAARVGTHVLSTAGGTILDNLEIGPGTCGTGVLLDGRARVSGIIGQVASANWPNAIGVEVSNSVQFCKIEGELAIANSGTAVVYRGYYGYIDLFLGGVSPLDTGRVGVRVYSVPNPPYSNLQTNNNDFTVGGYSTAGYYFDLNDSELNIAHRNGERYNNVFNVRRSGSNANPVRYPGGGTTFNLYAGNQVFINGVAQHSDVYPMLSYGSSTSLTIATGAITVTKSYHKVDTQSAAATDDLDTINGGVNGQQLIIRAANSARTVSVTEAGNIKLSSAPFDLDNTEDTLTLVCEDSVWYETARSNNGA